MSLVETLVSSNNNFIGELFSVASGSFVKNNTYGSGSALVHSLLKDGFEVSGNFTTASGTGIACRNNCRVRVQDYDYKFDVEVDLNLGATGVASGYGGTEEIRLRPAGGVGATIAGGAVGAYKNEPATYHSQFAPARDAPHGPRFKEVYVIDAYTGNELLPANGHLEAYLLVDGSLALVNHIDGTGTAPANSAMTVAQLFGLVTASRVVRVVVRGDYVASQVNAKP